MEYPKLTELDFNNNFPTDLVGKTMPVSKLKEMMDELGFVFHFKGLDYALQEEALFISNLKEDLLLWLEKVYVYGVAECYKISVPFHHPDNRKGEQGWKPEIYHDYNRDNDCITFDFDIGDH